MFRTRFISGIVLIIIALVFIIMGGTLLLTGLCIISIIGLFEFYRIFHIEKTILGYLGYCGAVLYYLDLYAGYLPDRMIYVLGMLVLFMAAYVFAFPQFKADQILAAFFGIFYVVAMLACIYQIRMLSTGAYIVWLAFICSWGCDTCAYCVGVSIGKHKLAPQLSPKKSVEGAVGGVVGAIFLTIIYGFVFQKAMGITVPLIYAMASISGIGALISMIGDLAASAIKRNYGIKDYGKLIPGHGGILDRFDSVIFTAPIIYYLSLYLM
ncbi:phosphatidate cytidylyltransferase [Lachnospiraceae bacterium ZAX-1]